MFCMECGTKLPDGAKFCMNCGTKLGQTAVPAPAAARGCTPGKKYMVFSYLNQNDREQEQDRNRWGNFYKTELYGAFARGFYSDYYARLDDGTAVGWVYQHIDKYKGEFDHYYNLYRVDTDGTATFLGAGSRSGIEEMFVRDGYAYWYGYGIAYGQENGWYRTNIYDTNPAEKLEKAPE